jgi:hypothetical protein
VVLLMSPEYLRSYPKAPRTATVMRERSPTRPTMRFVDLKRQWDMQSLHRAHERLVAEEPRSSTACVRSCWSADLS